MLPSEVLSMTKSFETSPRQSRPAGPPPPGQADSRPDWRGFDFGMDCLIPESAAAAVQDRAPVTP